MTLDEREQQLCARFLREACAFSDAEIEAVSRALDPREVPAGWCLTRQGGANEYVAFVFRGLFKMERTLACGTAHVVDFCAEGSVASDYVAWLHRAPADITIEALEPSRVALLRFADFEDFFTRLPRWNEFVRKMVEKDLLRLAERERQLLSSDAEDRYRRFVDLRRGYLPRLRGKDIAAYLGITPVSLSRLRGRRRLGIKGVRLTELPSRPGN